MSDNTNRLAGTAYLSVDGKTYRLAGDLKYQVSGFKRETLSGQDGPHGYSELPIPGYISASVRDSSDLKLSDINAMTNVTVVAELANGKTVIARNAWTVEQQEVNTTDAVFEVRWESTAVTEA
jgi:hypothetical protein